MKEIVNFAKIVSPKIAKVFGLQPAFVGFLIFILGGICYGVYQIDATFKQQNKLLIDQIETTNKTLEELTSKVQEHDVRLATLETKTSKINSEAISFRYQINESITRLDTKMDIVSVDIRELTNHAIRGK